MPAPRFDPRAPRSTRLARIRLRNFKSVREVDVSLAPLTLVAGANSAGKSSLLQAVLALTQVARRRVEGRRFPLNDDLTRLGTFETLRHQAAGQDDCVTLAAQFDSDDRDVRRSAQTTTRFLGHDVATRVPQEALPMEVRWVIELDSAVEDQIGSAQISAIEVSLKGETLNASARIERTSEASSTRDPRRYIAEALAFAGTIRVGDSETPVLDALIESAQFRALYGIPPEAPTRVREWFLVVADAVRDEGTSGLAATDPSDDRLVQQAAWAVREDVPPTPEFVAWYDSLSPTEQEQAEARVLDAYSGDRRRPTIRSGGIERLDGRGPSWLSGAQRACAQFLATRVRYVGPLRHAPHLAFTSASEPDLGDVGVAGEHVASVLQANRSLKRMFPVPSGGTEDLTLAEAVDHWLVFFGLAERLTVREDTPLVLSIDIVPPGLQRPVSLGSVGVGVSQVLPVLVQCLVAGPGALVVLEQPELHLHPAAQQRLADFLIACTRWGQSLLVESHSEYLVLRLRRRIADDPSDDLLKQVAVLFAERDGEGATTYRPVGLSSTGAVTDWPDGFFDQGPDEAHQLLVAAARKQRAQEGLNDED